MGPWDPHTNHVALLSFSPQCAALKGELEKEDAQKEHREAQEKELKLCKSVS